MRVNYCRTDRIGELVGQEQGRYYVRLYYKGKDFSGATALGVKDNDDVETNDVVDVSYPPDNVITYIPDPRFRYDMTTGVLTDLQTGAKARVGLDYDYQDIDSPCKDFVNQVLMAANAALSTRRVRSSRSTGRSSRRRMYW